MAARYLRKVKERVRFSQGPLTGSSLLLERMGGGGKPCQRWACEVVGLIPTFPIRALSDSDSTTRLHRVGSSLILLGSTVLT